MLKICENDNTWCTKALSLQDAQIGILEHCLHAPLYILDTPVASHRSLGSPK